MLSRPGSVKVNRRHCMWLVWPTSFPGWIETLAWLNKLLWCTYLAKTDYDILLWPLPWQTSSHVVSIGSVSLQTIILQVISLFFKNPVFCLFHYSGVVHAFHLTKLMYMTCSHLFLTVASSISCPVVSFTDLFLTLSFHVDSASCEFALIHFALSSL